MRLFQFRVAKRLHPNNYLPIFCTLALLILIFSSCEKDDRLEPLNLTDAIAPISTQLKDGINGEDQILKIENKLFENPTGTSKLFDLYLIPRLDYASQMKELEARGEDDLILESFSGILVGYRNDELAFKGFYDSGQYLSDIVLEERGEPASGAGGVGHGSQLNGLGGVIDDPRGLVRAGCQYAYQLVTHTIDWWQVTTFGGHDDPEETIWTYLGVQEITDVEQILTGCFTFETDELDIDDYLSVLLNVAHSHDAAVRIAFLEHLLENGIILIDFCNPNNDTNGEVFDAIVGDNPDLSNFTVDGFMEVYADYTAECLGIRLDFSELENITIIEDQQGVPVVSVNNPLCPNMFQFRATTNDPNPQVAAAGISGLNLLSTVNGMNIIFGFNHIVFEARPADALNCSQTLSASAATAINNGLIAAGQIIQNNNVINLDDRKFIMQTAITNAFNTQVNSCANTGIFLYNQVWFLDSDNSVWVNVFGTIFSDAASTFSTCN